MARTTSGRYVLVGRIHHVEPFLIGGLETDAGLDVSPMVNGAGQVVLPGTSLTGVLRSWCESVLSPSDTDVVAQFFGGTDNAAGLGAARLRVDDVIVEHNGFQTVDHVGIDRHTGAAASGAKFDQQVVVQGATGLLRIVCECPPGENVAADSPSGKMMAAVVSALHSGTLRVGRGTTKGFGRIRVDAVDAVGTPPVVVFQRADRNGLLERLARPTGGARVELALPPTDTSVARIRAKFTSKSPTFVKASLAGTTVDVIPRVVVREGRARLIVPATSMRGVLRAECERVMRTLLETHLDVHSPHFEQVRMPLVDEVFGIAPTAAAESDATDVPRSEANLGRAMSSMTALEADLCEAGAWARIEKCATSRKATKESARAQAEADLVKAIADAGDAVQFTHHVAIDRWTGGAADKMLYTVLEPTNEKWDEWSLDLDLGRLGVCSLPALAMVLIALQSLHDGSIGVGWGTYRGHGSISVSWLSVSMQTLPGGEVAVQPVSTSIWAALDEAVPDFMSALRTAWAEYLASIRATEGGRK